MKKASSFLWFLAIATASCTQPAQTNQTDRSALDVRSEDSSGTGPCDHGGVAVGKEVGIIGESLLYDKPNGERLINHKATNALGKTHYQQVDNSERLQELCRAGEWSKVQVLEPAWLTDVVGWVPISALRQITRGDGGARRYVEADFPWDRQTEPHKEGLLAAVNRVTRENPTCKSIDPGTLSQSPSRSRPGKPVFFVTCNGPEGQPFNVWFEPES